MESTTDQSSPPILSSIEVAIPSKVRGTFTYLAAEPVAVGARVMAPFGRQSLVGVVVKKNAPDHCPSHPTSPASFAVKQIIAVIDQNPIFSAELLTLAHWLSHYYIHPLGEVLKTMLPLGSQKKSKDYVSITEKGYGVVHLKQKEALLLSEMFRNPCIDPPRDPTSTSAETPPLPQVAQSTMIARILKHLESQAQNPHSWCWTLLTPPKSPSNTPFVPPPTALDFKAVKAGPSILKALSRRGLIRLQRLTDHHARPREPSPRGRSSVAPEFKTTPQDSTTGFSSEKPLLTAGQSAVVNTVLELGYQDTKSESQALRSVHQVFLLHGVTGSGKTEVYLHLIESLLRSSDRPQRQVLVLVPEISLTPQMTGVFSQRFPDQVAVVHSAMPDQQRWQQIEKIRNGQAQVLIGPRSAVFGPFQNLGLIIVDEEHDSSYKQDTGLRYHGRDVAVVRGKIHNIPVLLGSATPSLESYANALEGRYHLLELPERVGAASLPEVKVIPMISSQARFKASPLMVDQQDHHQVIAQDLESSQENSKETSRENSRENSQDTTIDPEITAALKETLDRGEQAIVLVNRRGYATFLKSLTTGKPYQCPQCSIAMALHRKTQLLRCHYCDQTSSVAQVLRDHPEESYGSVGYGSQKIEVLLKGSLPSARIARLDSDTMTGDILANVLGQFRQRQLDILVGTQMLAKGHDFPKVTLVVLLEVDQLLNLPDFRSGERTFQLIVQAAGRAGRSSTPGRVIMQAQQHQNPIVLAATQQNYHVFLEIELAQRKSLFYPPYSRMISFCFESKDQQKLASTMGDIHKWLLESAQKDPEVFSQLRVLGPSVPAIERLREAYRQMILLLAPNSHLKNLKNLASMLAHAFQKLPHGVTFTVDVDPLNLM